MNKFLLVRYRDPDVAEAITDRAIRRGLRALSFIPRRVVVHHFPEHRAILFSAEAHDPLRTGGYTHVERSSALSFSGVPHEPGALLPCEPSWARSLQQLLRTEGTEGCFRHLLGNYALASLGSDGTLCTFGDFSGMQPVYYMESPALLAVSNRQWLLSALCQDSDTASFDLLALSWLPGHANVFGDRMVHRGVRLLVPGRYLVASSGQPACVREFDQRFWRPPGGEYGDLGDGDFDRAAEALLEDYRPLASLDVDSIWLALTGGKDSRLNFAASVRAGIGDRLTIFTAGPKNSPEIECAASLSKHFGLTHHAQIATRQLFELDRVWDRLRFHPFLYDGSVCPWDGCTGITKQTCVEISGFGGELYRRHAKRLREVALESREQTKKLFENYHAMHDPLRVLRPEVVQYQNEFLHEWVDMRADAGVPLDDLPELFYVENRLALWSGILSSNSVSHVRLTPLAHPRVASICYRGGLQERRTERMHFELMRRFDRWLAEAPFLNDTWDSRLAPHWGGLDVATTPFQSKLPPTERNLVAWQWEFLEVARDDIAALLLDSPHSGLYDICRPEGVHNAIGRVGKSQPIGEAKEVLSLIALQLLLTGGYTCPKDDLRDPLQDTRLETNVEGLHLEMTPDGPCLVGREQQRSFELQRTLTHPSIGFGRQVKRERSQGVRFMSFALPSTSIRQIRIDPLESPGRQLLLAIELEVDGQITRLDVRRPDVLVPNSQMRILGVTEAGLLWESLDRDPYFVIPAFDDTDLRSAGEARLRVALVSEKGGRAELFWDDGTGFSQSRKIVALVPTATESGLELLTAPIEPPMAKRS